jgi:hypothetical protein
VYFKGRRGEDSFPAVNAPRQFPFVPLVEARLKWGKALENEEGKGLRRLFCKQEEETEQGCTAYDCNFVINIGRAELE